MNLFRVDDGVTISRALRREPQNLTYSHSGDGKFDEGLFDLNGRVVGFNRDVIVVYFANGKSWSFHPSELEHLQPDTLAKRIADEYTNLFDKHFLVGLLRGSALIFKNRLYVPSAHGHSENSYVRFDQRRFPLVELEDIAAIEWLNERKKAKEIHQFRKDLMYNGILSYQDTEFRESIELRYDRDMLYFLAHEVFPFFASASMSGRIAKLLGGANLEGDRPEIDNDIGKSMDQILQRLVPEKHQRAVFTDVVSELGLQSDLFFIFGRTYELTEATSLSPMCVVMGGAPYNLRPRIRSQGLLEQYILRLVKGHMSHGISPDEMKAVKESLALEVDFLRKKIQRMEPDKNEFGYEKKGSSQYRVLVRIPYPYVLKSPDDGKFYEFGPIDLCVDISSKGSSFSVSTLELSGVHLSREYKHPFFNGESVCWGDYTMTSRTKGGQIAEELMMKKMVLLSGYQRGINPIHRLTDHYFYSHEISVEDIKARGLPVTNVN